MQKTPVLTLDLNNEPNAANTLMKFISKTNEFIWSGIANYLVTSNSVKNFLIKNSESFDPDYSPDDHKVKYVGKLNDKYHLYKSPLLKNDMIIMGISNMCLTRKLIHPFYYCKDEDEGEVLKILWGRWYL